MKTKKEYTNILCAEKKKGPELPFQFKSNAVEKAEELKKLKKVNQIRLTKKNVRIEIFEN